MTVKLAASPTPVLDLIRKAGFDFVTGVPDSEFKQLISELELDNGLYFPATKEDNALTLAVGAYLGRKTPLIFMESSGFGNIIDVLTSSAQIYEVPLVLFIAWAGYKGRDVPHHNSIGIALPGMLKALDIPWEEIVLDGNHASLQEPLERLRIQAASSNKVVALVGIPEKFKDNPGGNNE